AVRGEDGHRSLGDRVVELVDEDGSPLSQLLDDVLVVDDLLAHVHRRAVELERALDRLHGPVDAGAVAARRGEQELLGGGCHRRQFRAWPPARSQRPPGAGVTVQSTGCTGRESTACHVAGSVVPVGGRLRAACRAVSAWTVDAPRTPSTGTAGVNETRCSWSQATSSPLDPLASAGQPGSRSGADTPGDCASVAHVAGSVACQLPRDSPPAP